MKREVRRILLVLGVINCCSCHDFVHQEVSSDDEVSQFPSLDSLLQQQSTQLRGKKIRKQITFGGQTDEMVQIAGNSSFDVFKDIDISGASYRDAYEVSERDGTLHFKRRGKKGPQSLSIMRTNNMLLAIHARKHEHNVLYSSAQRYSIEFDSETGLIKHYSFSGYQKLIFMDTVFFDISTSIVN